MSELIFRRSNARGYPVGESHYRCRHADAVVDRARQLRVAGMTYRQIAEEVGCSIGCAHDWINGRRRRPQARVIATRRPKRSGGATVRQITR